MAYKFWWLFILIFLLTIWLFFYFCCKNSRNCKQFKTQHNLISEAILHVDHCCSCQNNSNNIDNDTLHRIEDSIPKPPSTNCRVHFSGLLMGGSYESGNISKIYVEDDFSEYVGSGYYNDNNIAFPKSVKTTFDGIAIDKNTRLIIYEKLNFEGDILLDITGPAIINNVIWKDDLRYKKCNYEDFSPDLQANYPQSVRIWSQTNMHDWSNGSLKIICHN